MASKLAEDPASTHLKAVFDNLGLLTTTRRRDQP
jgi:hypothetical protein